MNVSGDGDLLSKEAETKRDSAWESTGLLACVLASSDWIWTEADGDGRGFSEQPY